MRVANDVTAIPTYVELRRPIYEAQPIPEQSRVNAERETQWSASHDVARAAAELAGPVTPTAPIAGSVIGIRTLLCQISWGSKEDFKL